MYKQVESVLLKIHNVSEESFVTFRGRIKHFQRIGLVTSAPGRGHKISYQIYDLLFWVYCFELVQIGIDPMLIKSILPLHMQYFIDAIEAVDKEKSDVLFVFYPNIMSGQFGKDRTSGKLGIDAAVGAMNIIIGGEKPLDTLKKNLVPRVMFEGVKSPAEVFGRRAIVFNITTLKRQIEAALAATPGVPNNLLRNITFERVGVWPISPAALS